MDSIIARLSIGKRDLKTADEISHRLAEIGFEIRDVSPRGISFSGSQEKFEQLFKTSVSKSPVGFTFEKSPEIPPEWGDDGLSVYIPTPPTFFS